MLEEQGEAWEFDQENTTLVIWQKQHANTASGINGYMSVSSQEGKNIQPLFGNRFMLQNYPS